MEPKFLKIIFLIFPSEGDKNYKLSHWWEPSLNTPLPSSKLYLLKKIPKFTRAETNMTQVFGLLERKRGRPFCLYE